MCATGDEIKPEGRLARRSAHLSAPSSAGRCRRAVTWQKQLIQPRAEFDEARAAGVELPQRACEVIDAVAVALAAKAKPAVFGMFVDVQAGGAVLVQRARNLARPADGLPGEDADVVRWVQGA